MFVTSSFFSTFRITAFTNMKNRIFRTAGLLECLFIDEFFQDWMQISIEKIDSVDIVCFLLWNRISCVLSLPVSNDFRYAEKNMFLHAILTVVFIH